MSGSSDLETGVWGILREVIDPELDCDIVSLGLIYAVVVEGSLVRVTMTMTTPGCPISDILPAAVKSMIEALPGITAAEVQVVWDPPWTIQRLSPSARQKLGVPEDDSAGCTAERQL